MKLARWRLMDYDEGVACMERWGSGEWVEYKDVEKLQRELDAWWAIAKTVLEDGRNTLCDESRALLENIVKEGAR